MKSESIFTGFTDEAFKFFAELEENNYRPWFTERKHIYENEILNPLKALAVALTPSFYEIDSQMDFRPEKMLSRIYRDIRFSKDKSPYKNHMWVMFQRPFMKASDDWASFPGYYIEIGKDGINLGMGLFQAKSKIMAIYRDKVEYDQSYFRDITESLITTDGFTLGGEEYKRTINKNLSEYYQTWIQKKGIHLYKNIPLSNKTLYSNELIVYLENQFAPLHRFYDFLVDVCD
ncbi:uncharacterized protein (TIGR02453 family) [Dysgonomonadaceae bacterium PH5-43]|nr:uncharacterized protein (TIGR02453 family) [Dysgonomonadaceae bacterium PH5-43]